MRAGAVKLSRYCGTGARSALQARHSIEHSSGMCFRQAPAGQLQCGNRDARSPVLGQTFVGILRRRAWACLLAAVVDPAVPGSLPWTVPRALMWLDTLLQGCAA